MIDSSKNKTEIQNDRNRFTIAASAISIYSGRFGPIMAADVFATHGEKASVVIIGIELA